MSKLRAGLILAVLSFSACAHHQAATPTEAGTGVRGDSDLTGIPPAPDSSPPPRATLVALPGAPLPVSTPTPPPVAAPVVSPVAPVPPAAAPVAVTAPPVTPTLANPVPVASSAAPDSAPASGVPPDAESTLATPGASAAPAPASAAEGIADTTAVKTTTPAPPDVAISSENSPLVVLQTSMGQIVIQLDDLAAPKTCKNFKQLVADDFYNHTVFHRVIPHFIIQGGDPNSMSAAVNRDTYGLGGPGYTLPPEIGLKNDRGAVAMARLPDEENPKRESNGSQFYICVAPCPSLDDQYTVFGHVIKGMDVVDRIANQPRDKRDNPLQRIEMKASLESQGQTSQENSAASP